MISFRDNRGQILISTVISIVMATSGVLVAYYTNQASIEANIHEVDIKFTAKESVDARQDEAIATFRSDLKEIKELQIQTLKEIRYNN